MDSHSQHMEVHNGGGFVKQQGMVQIVRAAVVVAGGAGVLLIIGGGRDGSPLMLNARLGVARACSSHIAVPGGGNDLIPRLGNDWPLGRHIDWPERQPWPC